MHWKEYTHKKTDSVTIGKHMLNSTLKLVVSFNLRYWRYCYRRKKNFQLTPVFFQIL